MLSVLCGIIAAVIWFLYSGLSSYTGAFDLLSPLVMIGLPVVLAWFRDPIDRLLLPIQYYRKKIGRPVLIGLGLIIPFMTAFILSGIGVRYYPLLSLTLIIGTNWGYALMRDPAVTEAPGKPGQKKVSALLSFLVVSNAGTPLVDNGQYPNTVPFKEEE